MTASGVARPVWWEGSGPRVIQAAEVCGDLLGVHLGEDASQCP